jgi:pimeloyl-ACP methyl ester carboxylesterase
MRVVAWDYRGLYESGPAPDAASYALPYHARDLLMLLEKERIEAPVLAGWSMGVQVNFEVHRSHPHIARALVALHGAYRAPLETAFDSDVLHRVAPPFFAALKRHWRWLMKPTPRIARSRRFAVAFMRACQRGGIMSERADPDIFHDMARDWVELDLGAYSEIFEHLAEHDAADLLESVQAPTLIVTGTQDRFTPRYLSESMAERIADSELLVLDGATHFGPIEFPDTIAQRMDRFLCDRVGLC